jgi:CRISPR-associated endonuclease/helicase Cas3
LISAHHGHGRPFVPVVDDPYTTWLSVELDRKGVSVSCNLSQADWDQPSRFRRLCERYGYWGLALLEAIVRQADQVASSVSGVA